MVYKVQASRRPCGTYECGRGCAQPSAFSGIISGLADLLRRACGAISASIPTEPEMARYTILNYACFNEPEIGKSATSQDKAGIYVDRPGEVTGELALVKGWFGLGQDSEVCNFIIFISFFLTWMYSIKAWL
jgi:hypothetical protein